VTRYRKQGDGTWKNLEGGGGGTGGWVENFAGRTVNGTRLHETVTEVPDWLPLGTRPNLVGMFNGWAALVRAPMLDTAHVTAMGSMFQGCSALSQVPLYNTGNVTDMASMFESAGVKSLPAFNMAKVTNLGRFARSSGLTAVPAGLDTSKVTGFQDAFAQTALASLPTGRLDFSAATNVSYTFQACTSLTGVGDFTFPAATNLSNMFSGCSSLASVGTLAFTSPATNKSYSNMFAGCSSLTNLGHLTFAGSATSAASMFNGCTNLTETPLVDLSAVSSTAGTTGIFTGCPNLSRNRAVKGLRFAFSVQGCNLGATALNEMFTLLGTASGTQAVNITGNPGAATCDRSIATAKGWGVTG